MQPTGGRSSAACTERRAYEPNDKKQQIALINHAIEKGWQGVYPIDNFKKGDRVEPTEKDYTTSTSAYEVL